MKTVLIVTSDAALRGRLQRVFSDWSAFAALNDAEALKTLRSVEVDAIFRDTRAPVKNLPGFITQAKELSPGALVVAVGGGEEEAEAADFVVPAAFTQRDLEAALRRLGDKQRLANELAILKTLAPLAPLSPTVPAPGASPSTTSALQRVLKEFSRVLAAGTDLPRVLDMFLEALGELLRPTRCAVLMSDGTEVYRVRAYRGLSPQVAEAVKMSASHGLARWLAAQGRPARIQDLSDPVLIAELKLLGGMVAVPLITQGELVAILVVGQPLVGPPYGQHETEILFDLATQLATAIRGISLHHQLRQEKEFSERILARMSSGVVTIGRDEKVGLVNRRAEEILGVPAADLVGQDLRALPSPLGDMLFETLTQGHPVAKSEVQLALRQLWLEVSTYPIHGEEPAPLGAVLVFEDRTTQKELAAQKRQAGEFQLLARTIARIADEIKNPLVSINTFVELVEERYEDPDFRKLFSSVVRRDVRRLVQVFEKLAGLVSEGELNFTTVDANAVIDEVVTAVEVADEGPGKRLQLDVTRDRSPQPIRVDAVQFRKALSYLVWYLTYSSPGEEAKVSISVGRHGSHGNHETPDEVRILIGSRTATVAADKLERIFDPVQMVQESLIEVGPAVSQRLIEALGGRLRVRQGRHEVAFQVTLPPAS